MKAFVTVMAHPVTGLAFTESTNPAKAADGWGKMHVNTVVSTLKNNLESLSKRSAFIAMKRENFDFKQYKVGMKLEGIIQRKLAFTPFYEKADGNPQEPVTKGTGGEVVLLNGAPYFQDYEFLKDADAPSDRWILPATIPAEIVATPADALSTSTVKN